MGFRILRITNEMMGVFRPFLPPECRGASEGDLILGALSDEGVPVGVLYGKLEPIGFELRYIYVLSGFRRQGVASAMMSGFLRTMLYLTPIPPVYAIYTGGEESYELGRFLENSGCFFLEEQEAVFVLSAEDRKKSQEYRRLISKGSRAVLFFETDPAAQREFLKRMSYGGHPCVPALAEGLYSPVLSTCHYSARNGITAAVFFTVRSEKEVELSYAYADESDLLGFGMCLTEGLLELESCFPEADLEITPMNESITEMIQKLSMGYYKMKHVMLAQWNYGEL